MLLESHFILGGLHLSLGCLLCFRVFNRLDDLLLFLLVDQALSHVLFNQHFLLEIAFLIVLNFLGDTLVVTLLQAHDVLSTLLCLFDFLPGAHFFLLEEGNTIGKHVCIFFNAKLNSILEKICNLLKTFLFGDEGSLAVGSTGPLRLVSRFK